MSADNAVMHPDDECRPAGVECSGCVSGCLTCSEPSPGQRVLIPAVVARMAGEDALVRVGGVLMYVPLNDIHPAPTIAR